MGESSGTSVRDPNQRISQSLDNWKRQLLDTSKISKLINCRFSRGSGGVSAGGALLIEHPKADQLWADLSVGDRAATFAWASSVLPASVQEPVDTPTDPDAPGKPSRANLTAEELQQALASPHLAAEEMLTTLFDKRMDAVLKRMSLAAQTSLSEQGINSLFLAFGFVHWFESIDSETELVSPLLLLPVSLSKEHGQSTWVLRPLEEEIAINHSLAQLFQADFRISLPTAEDEDLRESPETFANYLTAVRAAIAQQTRWTVEPGVALGSFGFQKIAMWQDLRRNEQHIIDHPLCRSVAGDVDAIHHDSSASGGGEPASTPIASTGDEADPSPADHHLILDCDGSQLAAIAAVKNGSHLILDGPPGTGKSQTIANIIAESLAAGKTVLFVSEKAAALDVVKHRLDLKKLGDFCLECHSHKANKRAVIEELGRCLSHEPEQYPSQDEKLAELDRCRRTLNRYVQVLHAPRSALSMSAFEMHARLAPLKAAVSRVVISDPHQVSKAQLQAMEETVARLVRCAPIIARRGEHEWKGCRPEFITLSFVDDARHHFQKAAEALEQRRTAAAPLVELGLLSDEFTEAQLNIARKQGLAASTFPLIPEAWVKRGLRKSADVFIRLDEIAGEFRITLSAAKAFRNEALATATPDAFATVQRLWEKLRPQIPSLPPTVREARTFLSGVATAVSAAITTIAPLAASADALAQMLTLTDAPRNLLEEIDSLAKAANLLISAGRLPAAWFDDAKRAFSKNAGTEANQAAQFAQVIRKPLENRLQSLAFSAASSPLVDDILNHSGFFSQFGAAWRRAKQAFIGLYTAPPPGRSGMIDDAHQLRRFRAAHDALTAAAQRADAASLGWDGTIDFDWQVPAARIAQIESLPESIRRSPGFAQIATHLEPQLAGRIRTSAADLDRARSAFDVTMTTLAEKVQLSSRRTDAPLPDLLSTLQSLQKDVTDADAAIARLLDYVTPDADLRFDELHQDADVLSTLRSLQAAASAEAAMVDAVVAPMESGNLGDFGSEARLAQWSLKYLAQFAGHPPDALNRLLFDKDARKKLADGLKAIDHADTAELGNSIKFVTDAFLADQSISTGITLSKATELERIAWLSARSRDAKSLLDWRDYLATSTELDRAGLTALREEVLAGSIEPRDALDAFRARFYKRWLDEAYQNEPLLREFDPGVHDHVADRFRELDRFWIYNGFSRIRPALLEQCPKPNRLGIAAPATSEIGVLLRETNKKRRHLPLRKLFAQMPTLLQRLKPCIMMSPLAVSTFFESSDARFDLVIFDEASQVRPHDAICAIYRGKQLVVAGDQKQLPPTNFFERLTAAEEDNDDEETASTNDYESILDTCASLGLPRQRLKWHYRSKRESLISFSNRNFYDGELITFPSVLDVDSSSGVTFNYIADAKRGKSGSVTNAVEATRLAEAVIRHATLQPALSLGIITMNVSQQSLVLDEIARLRKQDSKCESFFATDNREPFFVKNLENVQGDERDVIFIGIGFAKDETGRLNHSFGPLNRAGGERRLNVAVTRARQSLVVFSSIKASDIDRSRTAAVGPALLQAYLDFAERGRAALNGTNSERSGADNDSPFEAEVERALKAQGLDVRRQVGCCGYRIDLAIVHPERKGQYVLGVEADGATYHSSASARDRDRLRQELLESLGWTITRIWSTDWIRNPQRQIERVMSAYQTALARAEVSSATQTPPPTDTVANVATNQEPPKSTATRQFDSIDEVPFELIEQSFCQCLAEFGSTTTHDLLQHVARGFGFARTGTKIRDTLTRTLDELQRLGRVHVADDRISLAEPAK